MRYANELNEEHTHEHPHPCHHGHGRPEGGEGRRGFRGPRGWEGRPEGGEGRRGFRGPRGRQGQPDDTERGPEFRRGFRGPRGPRGWEGRPEGGERRRGFGGPRGWEGGPGGLGLDRETVHDIRKTGGRLMQAFVQASRTGDADQREKAKAIADEARRSLFRLLAEER